MMQELTVMPLKYKSLDGLSERQLAEHHDVLYAGYVKKVNEIRSKLETADRAEANATFSLFGELKRQETFAANGVRLHEHYFDNMGGDGIPNGDILEMIKSDFGSLENWRTDIVASGISARGWVVTAFDLMEGHLYNYCCDAHNIGCIWNCVPLVVLDVYEHAYFIDYGTNRKAYLETFMKTLNFNYVNEIIGSQNLMRAHVKV